MSEIIEQLEQSGERAFPFATKDFLCAGMTLRDYFAAKAMQGMFSVAAQCEMDDRAELAYEMADAMLKARGEK